MSLVILELPNGVDGLSSISKAMIELSVIISFLELGRSAPKAPTFFSILENLGSLLDWVDILLLLLQGGKSTL